MRHDIGTAEGGGRRGGQVEFIIHKPHLRGHHL